MLAFCMKCDNIMVLKRREGRIGTFICRSCGALKKIKIAPLEIREEVRILVPQVPVY